ncbi:MAG: Asp-tRNA(Asn)/Glu-tRNA(Gln) amidotransferase subunit GatA [Nitrospirota bacterium]|nr:Asp-tRNA(Asn)/Glu-tRNA(Gln) amidotransferase subunit GatA [Nitrospirota bacterium]
MSQLHRRTIHELHELLKKREVSSREITQSVLDRISAVDTTVGAFLHVEPEKALQEADEVDKTIRGGGHVTPLTGIPVAIKDNLNAEGLPTTCASKILKGFRPPYDATVVHRLKQNGAVTVGKLNMDEFAMGSSTENSAYQKTRNPWDTERIPGGSSGGSAASVAADECIAALGSDTGGSIRQPASCCGVVGLKPTYGRVSRYGLVAFASSLDQIGPLTKDVTDAALMMNVIAGHDHRDSTSANVKSPDYTRCLEVDMKGKVIGIPKEYFIEGMDREVEQSVRGAIKVLEGLGAEVKEISLPHTDYAVATYYILATAEASSNLARYDGVKYGHRTEHSKDLVEMYMKSRAEGFGPEVKRRIMLGTYVLSSGYYDAYYRKAQQVRTLIKQDFDDVFGDVDLIVTPTAPTPAFKFGEKTKDPLQMYLSDIFTISVNLAGVPGISVPCGYTSAGLPIGLQIIGKHFDEETVLQAAYSYEQSSGIESRKPAL